MRQLADEARELDPRPNTVARLENEDGSFTIGRSGFEVEPHPVVQAALDDVPMHWQSAYHGKCAEIDAMSQNVRAAEAAGRDPASANQGAFIQTAQVRGQDGDQSRHGVAQAPCSSCQHVMNQLGVAYHPR
jgi:hypothetical protein